VRPRGRALGSKRLFIDEKRIKRGRLRGLGRRFGGWWRQGCARGGAGNLESLKGRLNLRAHGLKSAAAVQVVEVGCAAFKPGGKT